MHNLNPRAMLASVPLACAALISACGAGSSDFAFVTTAGAQTTAPLAGTQTTAPSSAPAESPGAARPSINATKLSVGSPGVGVDIISRVTELPKPSTDGTGDFRTVCAFSHMNFDDPIVYPGQTGRSHLHAFFGNTGTNANSTAESLASTGNSTCRGGTINRSAYWQPAIIDTKDGTPVKPRTAIIYYKSAAFALPADIQPLPQGLRMLAGDPNGRAPVQWGPAAFSCNGTAVGSDRDFPPTAGNPGPHSIPNCTAGTEVWASVVFPRCWDGVNLDSPDHRSHMAYWPIPNPYVDAAHPAGKCPPTHPIALPEVAITAVYPVVETNAPLRWRLSSDAYDKSTPGGYSLHADWFGGWKPEIVKTWTSNCVNAAKDCSAHMLGDGRTMLDVGL